MNADKKESTKVIQKLLIITVWSMANYENTYCNQALMKNRLIP
jgi:hypothetical protein